MVEYKNFTNECGIYCFTNKVNGKCYVGQGINLRKRLRAHYAAMKRNDIPNMIFYRAVNKYGIENFDLEILEFLDPMLNMKDLKKLLDAKEKFYIKEKNSYVPYGYNQTLGGDAGVLGYKMTDEQKERICQASKIRSDKYKKRIWLRKLSEPKYFCGYTYQEAVKKSGVSRTIIQAICNNRYSHPYAKGWVFANSEIELFHKVTSALKDIANGTYNDNLGKFKTGEERMSKYNSKKIIETDLCGNILNTFSSIKKLSIILEVCTTTVTRHLKSGLPLKNRMFKY